MDDFKTLRGREITHKFNTFREVDTVKVVEKSDEFSSSSYESDSNSENKT